MRPTKYDKPLDVTIQTRVDMDLVAKLDYLCVVSGENRSDLVRKILEYGVENFKKIKKG